MLLSELVANYKPIYPSEHSWDATVQFMLDDPIERKTVEYLVTVLNEQGSLREAVTLGSATINDVDDVPTVVDGTHRVCAHILANKVNIFTRFEGDPRDEEDVEAYQSTIIKFTKDLTDDEMDELFSVLRSFPLTDDVWYTSGCSSMSSREMSIAWDTFDESFTGALTEKVKLLLTAHGYGDFVTDIRTITEYYEDAV